MEATGLNLVNMTTGTNVAVNEYTTQGGKYCSFRAYYGKVLAELEDADIETDSINERHYFRALEKLKLAVRGNISTSTDRDTGYVSIEFTPNRMGNLYPPANIIEEVTNNDFAGVYRVKRGTYGFNCGAKAEDELYMKVLIPVIELLSDMIYDINTKMEELENNRDGLKTLGISLSDAKKVTATSIINKYL